MRPLELIFPAMKDNVQITHYLKYILYLFKTAYFSDSVKRSFENENELKMILKMILFHFITIKGNLPTYLKSVSDLECLSMLVLS